MEGWRYILGRTRIFQAGLLVLAIGSAVSAMASTPELLIAGRTIQGLGSAFTPQDRFAIGGRYTARGFDGENSLLGERGWLIRNDLGWALGQSGAELYAGMDYGHIGGPSADWQLGADLAGGVIGIRGTFRGLGYDIFVGAPIRKPEGFRTARVSGGFSLNYSF